MDIFEIIKDVSFGKNALDKIEWQPIDEKIPTEMHEKYQILPCLFPHSDYRQTHKIQLPKERRKGGAISKPLPMIKPQDDSQKKIQRSQSNRQAKKINITARERQKKQHKKKKNRARRKAKKASAQTEIDGLAIEKQLFTNTMDQ